MSNDVVNSGQSVSGLSLSAGEFLILNGGSSTDLTLTDRAVEAVFSGSVAEATVVGSLGTIDLDGGIASDADILNGGVVHVSSGGQLLSSTISGGGVIEVISGGSVTAATISSGATETLSSGAVDQGSTILTGGALIVLPGAHANATVISGGSVISSGVIVRSSGQLISAAPSITNTLLVQSASIDVLSGGTLNGSDAEHDTLTVWSGGTVASTTIGGPAYIQDGAHASALTVVSGGVLSLATSLDVDNTIILSGGSEVLKTGSSVNTIVSSGGNERVSGGFAEHTDITNGGTETLTGGFSISATIESGGLESVTNSGAFSFNTTVKSGGILNNYGNTSATLIESGGILEIHSYAVSQNTSASTGASILLPDIAFTSAGLATYDPSTGSVHFAEGGVAISVAVGSQTGHAFAVSADALLGTTGTLITVSDIACFRAGTNLLARQGETQVERLRVGDELATLSGDFKPIRWIGRRNLRAPIPRTLLPIRVAAHAFRPSRPARDLFLSPEHAVLVDGALIPISALCNGFTIHPVEVDAVTYFHIELADHDIVFAECLATETYLDNDNRHSFDSATPAATAASPKAIEPYAPYVRQGPVVEAARASLAPAHSLATA